MIKLYDLDYYDAKRRRHGGEAWSDRTVEEGFRFRIVERHRRIALVRKRIGSRYKWLETGQFACERSKAKGRSRGLLRQYVLYAADLQQGPVIFPSLQKALAFAEKNVPDEFTYDCTTVVLESYLGDQ